MAAGIYRSHLPMYAPEAYFKGHPTESIALLALKADDLEDVPPAGKAMAAHRADDFKLVVESGKYRELLQAYMASVSFADAMVGRLLDALDAGSAAHNTIVVLWSDHGWHLGEKPPSQNDPWERSTRIPMVLAASGWTEAGGRCDRAVGAIDLFPTLIQPATFRSFPYWTVRVSCLC